MNEHKKHLIFYLMLKIMSNPDVYHKPLPFDILSWYIMNVTTCHSNLRVQIFEFYYNLQ